MKKIFAIILAALMLIAIAVPALADDYDFNSAEFYANDNECPHKAGGTYTDSYRYDEFNDTINACIVLILTPRLKDAHVQIIPEGGSGFIPNNF